MESHTCRSLHMAKFHLVLRTRGSLQRRIFRECAGRLQGAAYIASYLTVTSLFTSSFFCLIYSHSSFQCQSSSILSLIIYFIPLSKLQIRIQLAKMKYSLFPVAIISSVSAAPGYFYNNPTTSDTYPIKSSHTISSKLAEYPVSSHIPNESTSTNQTQSPSMNSSITPTYSKVSSYLVSASSMVPSSAPSGFKAYPASSQPFRYPTSSTSKNMPLVTGYPHYPEASQSIEYPYEITKTMTSTLYSWIPCSTPVARSGKTTFYSTYLTASTYTTVVTKVYLHTPAPTVLKTYQPAPPPAPTSDKNDSAEVPHTHPSIAPLPIDCPAPPTSTVTVYFQMPVTLEYTEGGELQTTVITPQGGPKATKIYPENPKPTISQNTPNPSLYNEGPEPLPYSEGLNPSSPSASSGHRVPSYAASSQAPYPLISSSCSSNMYPTALPSSSSRKEISSTALPSSSSIGYPAHSPSPSSSKAYPELLPSSAPGDYTAHSPSPPSSKVYSGALAPSSASSQLIPMYSEHPAPPSPATTTPYIPTHY